MSLQSVSQNYEGVVEATPRLYRSNRSSENPSSSQNHSEGISMEHSYEKNSRRSRGDRRATISRVSTRDLSDWLKGEAQRYSDKELADAIGGSVKTAQNIRAGLSGCLGTTLSTWCMNDKLFAAKYFEYVGLLPPGSAEFTARMNEAIAASQRMQMGGDAE